MRQAFNFYSSYDEVASELNDKQLSLFIRALLDVQFFRKHIDSISFEDKMVSISWKASKHSVKKQLEGYCNANKIVYESLFNDVSDAYEAGYKGAYEAGLKGASAQGEGQGEGEGQVQGQVQEAKKSKGEVQVSSPTLLSAIKIADFLFKNIRKINPSFKEPNLEAWSKDIELALRIDKRTEQELVDCIRWIYTSEGSFWQKNILSGKKLREKFDTMNMQVRTVKPKASNVVDDMYSTGLSAKDLIREMESRA